jgi:HEAT repeat protein
MAKTAESPFEQAIKKCNSHKVIPSLDNHNPEIRIAAIQALAQIADDHAMNALIGMIHHNDLPTRLAAIKALGVAGKQSGKSHLQHLLVTEKDDAVKAAAREAIAAIPLIR